MIVDCHMHAWQHPADLGLPVDAQGQVAGRLAADVSDLSEDLLAVDLGLVWGFASGHLGAEVTVEFLGQRVGLQGDRMIGIVGLDPRRRGWREALLEAVDEWSFRGVTLCPPCQDLHPTDSRALDLYELCQARGLPVMIDLPARWTGEAAMTFARPDLLDGVAREFPDLKILVSGFGYPYVEQTLVLLEKHPGVYTDTAHLVTRPRALANALHLAHESGLMAKVLFGSSFPFLRPRQAMAALYHQCAPATAAVGGRPLPRQVIADLIQRDTLLALGIPRPPNFVERPGLAAPQEEPLGNE